MLLVIMGILFVFVGFIFVFKIKKKVMAISIVLGVSLCFLGVFCPVSGYEEPIIQEEYELEKIVSEENIYVVQTKYNTFKYLINERNNEKENKLVMYTNSDVEIIVLENIVKPFIRKYSVKAKKSIFTFAILPEKIEYRIFINEQHIESLISK